MSFLGVGRCWFGLGGLSKRQLGQWRWWRWSCWQATEADGGEGRAEQVRALLTFNHQVTGGGGGGSGGAGNEVVDKDLGQPNQ